jgi:hypothetical protein
MDDSVADVAPRGWIPFSFRGGRLGEANVDIVVVVIALVSVMAMYAGRARAFADDLPYLPFSVIVVFGRMVRTVGAVGMGRMSGGGGIAVFAAADDDLLVGGLGVVIVD